MNESLREILLSGSGGVISLVGAGGKTSLMFRLAREAVMAGDSVLTTTTTRIMSPNENHTPKVFLAKTAKTLLEMTRGFQQDNLHLTAALERAPNGRKLTGFDPSIIDSLHRSGRFKWIIVEADGAARKNLKAPAAHEPVIPKATGRVIGVVGLKAMGKPLTNQWVFRHEIFSNITGLAINETVTAASIALSIVSPVGLLKGTPRGAKQTIFLNLAGDHRALDNGRDLAKLLCENTDRVGLAGVIIGNAQDDPAVLEYHRRCRADEGNGYV